MAIPLSIVQAVLVALINDSIAAAIVAGLFLVINTLLTLYLTHVQDHDERGRPRWRGAPARRETEGASDNDPGPGDRDA